MYSSRPGYIIGFHGCDESVRNNILTGKDNLKPSKNIYDWLGHGFYFWENNMQRAFEFAQYLKEHPRKGKSVIKKPAVLGAIISLGNCLDLLDRTYLELLQENQKILESSYKTLGLTLPANRIAPGTDELMLRDLDCLVIEDLHSRVSNSFDSVRAVFIEGKTLYPTSGFNEQNHIQICIRNPNCIKGYFLPRAANNTYRKV